MSGESLTRVTIEELSRRGEGIAACEGERIRVPYALPGDLVSIDREDGERVNLIGVIAPSPDRVAPICPHFTTCGGCAVQAWCPAPYREWKRGLLISALSRTGLGDAVAPLIDAHGAGRRRATFHSRVAPDGRVVTGFMQARAHTIVPIEACPILDPRLDGALAAARAIARTLAASGKPLDILCTASDAGLDIDLRGQGPLDDAAQSRLVAVAAAHDIARLTNHGTIVIERRRPTMQVATARVELPPGAFLQATDAGEAALATRVVAALAGAKRIADLFSGFGTFALRLAGSAEVTAIDTEAAALRTLDKAARTTPGLRPVATETRDLHRRPLTAAELGPFDAVCLDPPRAGAEAQMRVLAASSVGRVASVSCDTDSFARDAAILTAAGFTTETIVPVDQFRYSAHVEIIAAFRRTPPKRKRRLLG